MNRITAALAITFVAVVAPSRASADEPTVLLHVDSPRVVAIERADDGELVCTSPCDARVPATARYRIAGSRPSDVFMLDAHKNRATIAADPATRRSFVFGVAALGAGSALAIAGGIVLGLTFAAREPIPADGTTTDTSYTDYVTAGTVMVLTGAGAAIWGGGTALANSKTKVSGDIVGPPPARGTGPLPTTQAAIMIPILGGTF